MIKIAIPNNVLTVTTPYDERLSRKAARKLEEIYFPFGASYFRERAN